MENDGNYGLDKLKPISDMQSIVGAYKIPTKGKKPANSLRGEWVNRYLFFLGLPDSDFGKILGQTRHLKAEKGNNEMQELLEKADSWRGKDDRKMSDSARRAFLWKLIKEKRLTKMA